jgi:hypothetical protein
MLLDLILLAILVWATFRVASEGAWGAVLVFFCALFAGLLAMNTFEPLAEWLGSHVSQEADWQFRFDVISLLGLFALAVFALRVITERLAPARIPIPQLFDVALRYLAGAATGYLMICVLLVAVHVAPLPRIVTGDEVIEIAGFEAERPQFFGLGPDRQWLRLNLWLSQQALNRDGAERLFDGPIYQASGDRGLWPSLPIRYADRRERMTRARMGLEP